VGLCTAFAAMITESPLASMSGSISFPKMTATVFAFDSDFSRGTVSNTTCQKTGNDCYDFSASQVSLKNIEVVSAGDKGFSVGEKSIVDVYNAQVYDSHVGFASKDSSTLSLDAISLNSTSIGISAYQKKPEYLPKEF